MPSLSEARKSSRYERIMARLWCTIVGLGLLPRIWPGEPRIGSTTLRVRGRRSGKMRTVAVTWVEVTGQRYLIAMLGEQSDWVHNARATSGAVTFRRGRRKKARLEELPVGERAAVMQVWYRRTGRLSTPRKYVGLEPDAPLESFAEIAPRWPVFRILPSTALP